MTSLRLLAVRNVPPGTPPRANRLAPRPGNPLAHFVSPSGKKSRPNTIPLVYLLLLFVPVVLSAQSGGYVGSTKCGVCHEEEAVSFRGSPHELLEESARWESLETACESCHGPGLSHVLGLDPARLTDFRVTQPDQVNGACLECHGSDIAQAGRSFNEHSRNGVACTSCHQVHGSDYASLLSNKTDALCSSCHTEVRAAFNRPFRHKLQEGAISCIDCHNPHGDPPPAQMARIAANETSCLKCHADKRGPFPFEHAPVKLEPCSACHEPHGSANPRLMTRHNTSRLCIECHTADLATLGGSPPAFHDIRTARFQNCTVCHSKIHGSFVSRDFLR